MEIYMRFSSHLVLYSLLSVYRRKKYFENSLYNVNFMLNGFFILFTAFELEVTAWSVNLYPEPS
jgi:hypothetical protein